jgi:hypothetical protein
VSSAILYLAIIAIWAFLLVPRWVRRPHTAFFSGTDSAGRDSVGPGPAGHGSAGSHPADDDSLGHDGEPELASADSDTGGHAEEPAMPRLSVLRSVGLDDSAEWRDEPDADTGPLPVISAPLPSGGEPAPASAPGTTSAPPAGTPGAADDFEEPHDSSRPARSARPPISRSKILQARRRLLTTLVLLAIAAFTCTALKLTSWWVCVPPTGMLGMYLLLLREASLADAENARWRAERAGAARQRARARSRQAWAERTPQPTAEIIDISARLGDQLYDQYADAAVRAVGD